MFLSLPKDLNEGVPLSLASLVSTKSLLGELESFLAVLGSAGFDELHHTLLIPAESANFVHYLPDEFDSAAGSAFEAGLFDFLGLFLGLLDFGSDEALVEADRNTLLLGGVFLNGVASVAHL